MVSAFNDRRRTPIWTKDQSGNEMVWINIENRHYLLCMFYFGYRNFKITMMMKTKIKFTHGILFFLLLLENANRSGITI